MINYFERRVRRLFADNAEANGAKPHGQKDKVLPPNKLISALPTTNREPTLSVCHLRPTLPGYDTMSVCEI